MSTGAFRNVNAVVAAHGALAVTPNDATVLNVCRSLYIGTGGNISVVMADGQTVSFANVPGGTIFPIQVQGVLSTGTTASNIVALF